MYTHALAHALARLAQPSSSSRARAAAFAAFLLRSEWRYEVTHERMPASVLNSVFGIRLHGLASLRSNAEVSKQRPILRTHVVGTARSQHPSIPRRTGWSSDGHTTINFVDEAMGLGGFLALQSLSSCVHVQLRDDG